jgi:pimeloyl-ACP methyl ester carboxylesterase
MSLCDVIAKAEQPKYEKIKIPLLILAGEEDKTAPLKSSEDILLKYGTAEKKKKLEILKGVGHWHCVEASEEVGKFVKEYLESSV